MKKSEKYKYDFGGLVPESWCCVDCGVNTAPGFHNRAALEQAAKTAAAKLLSDKWSVPQTIDDWSEVYMVNRNVWKKAGMAPMGGCLCIGCLEKRLGRQLRPKDFSRQHPFNAPDFPGTARLKVRQGR